MKARSFVALLLFALHSAASGQSLTAGRAEDNGNIVVTGQRPPAGKPFR